MKKSGRRKKKEKQKYKPEASSEILKRSTTQAK